MNEAVEKIPCGSDRLMYLPYLMGERTPHLNPEARGVFFGLSAIHTKENMMRAVMEGVAYSLSDCYDILKGMGVNVSEMMACGGGRKSPVWRQCLLICLIVKLRHYPQKKASTWCCYFSRRWCRYL